MEGTESTKSLFEETKGHIGLIGDPVHGGGHIQLIFAHPKFGFDYSKAKIIELKEDQALNIANLLIEYSLFKNEFTRTS